MKIPLRAKEWHGKTLQRRVRRRGKMAREKPQSHTVGGRNLIALRV